MNLNGSRYGIHLPTELQNLYQIDTEDVFVCFRLNYQRLIRKIANADANFFLEVKKFKE